MGGGWSGWTFPEPPRRDASIEGSHAQIGGLTPPGTPGIRRELARSQGGQPVRTPVGPCSVRKIRPGVGTRSRNFKSNGRKRIFALGGAKSRHFSPSKNRVTFFERNFKRTYLREFFTDLLQIFTFCSSSRGAHFTLWQLTCGSDIFRVIRCPILALLNTHNFRYSIISGIPNTSKVAPRPCASFDTRTDPIQ